MPPTRGGRCDGGVNDAAARADRARALPGRARPSAPDVRRRACWVGVEAGRAMRATGATSRGITMVDGWGRVTGGDGRLTDGGETTIVINDGRPPRRGNREHRLALTCCDLKRRETRSHRGVLLAITGIIAHKNQFRAKSIVEECITS